MRRHALLFIASLSTCLSAHAQYANIEGVFDSPSTSLNLVALDSTSGVIAASTVVVQGPCSGTITGIGKMSGNELTLSPYVKADSGDACVVKVTFNDSRDTATIEATGCSAYSGPACGWEGNEVKRVK